MINMPGAAKTMCLKELTARKKSGQGVTKAVESVKTDSFWKSKQARVSTHLELDKNGFN